MIQSKFKRRSVEDSKGAPRNKKMKSEREKLVPWMIQKVESGEVPGLYWLDKEKTKFRITWKHAGKPDFELDRDAVLFRMWAEHTGKYKRGEQPDPSTWKTRFRCALRKMPDIEEVRVPHSLDEKEPYRVFRLKSRVPKIFSVLDTPSPSPTNDTVEGQSNYSSMPAASNQYIDHSRYSSMTCNPAVDAFSFPSPNSSHTSSPTHTPDISNSSPGSVFSDEEDSIDNITPTLPPLPGQTYQQNDFHMGDNGFGNGFGCTNTNLGYYPTGNVSYGQSLLNFVERSIELGYGGGGCGTGMYQGIPYSGVTSNSENFDQNSDGSSTCQLGMFLKMLHAAAMETDGLEYDIPGNTASPEHSMSHGFQQIGEQVKQLQVNPLNSYSEKQAMNDLCKLENTAGDCYLIVRVFYEERQVATYNLDKQHSTWRVFYGKQDPRIDDTTVYSHLYGASGVKQIQLPELQCSNETQRVLANFSRGLVLEMSSDGDIWATRKSATKVFFSSGSIQSTKLIRDIKTRVFNFSEFQRTLQDNHKESCSLPPCDVTFTLGWPNGLMVCMVITHAQAKKMLLDKMNGVQSITDPSSDQIVFDLAGQFIGTVLLENRDQMSVKFS